MMNQTNTKKDFFSVKYLGFILLQLLIIWMLFIFFNNINPLIPFNSDDWIFLGGISSFRFPYPDIHAWNPIKVFPEILQPLSGLFGAYVIYPITHNYVDSLTMSMALCSSFMGWFLFYSFYAFIKKRWKTSQSLAVMAELLFALSFFGLFKQYHISSEFGFWGIDVTCFYHYVLTGIVNAGLVLYILKFDDFIDSFKDFSYLKKGLLILWAYLAIFSSIQISHILAFTCFALFVFSCVQDYKKLSVLEILKKNAFYVYIGLMWLLSLCFELMGGRSRNLSSYSDSFFNHPFSETIEKFLELFRQVNKVYFTFFAVFVLLACFTAFKKRKKKNNEISFMPVLIMMSAAGLSVLYLFLLYTKTPVEYAGRADAQWSVIFWIICICVSSLAYIMKSYPKWIITVPLILFILGSIALNPFTKFRSINANTEFSQNVNAYILEKVEDAISKGQKNLEIQVPVYPLDLKAFDNVENPDLYKTQYNDYLSGSLSSTLYQHGITPSKMNISIIANPDLNQEFYGSSYENRYLVNQ